MQNKLRIIGGEWRSRVIRFDESPGLRPTPIRVRETVFNWLQQDVGGSRCLDLFAGSGALGFEAASRGAKKVTLVEHDAQVCRALHTNVEALNALQVQVKNQEVMRFLAGNAEPCSLVFLDPPFANDCAEQVCNWLEDKGWLMSAAKIYVEVPARRKLVNLPHNWTLLKQKVAGEVGYHLFVRG